MSASKRPSTSSLRRFITSRPYVAVAELRRRFGLDDPDAMTRLERNGTAAWIGLPEREANKLQDLLNRDELGLELSVEVRAPVVVGIYPLRIARFVLDGAVTNGHLVHHGNGAHPGNGVQPAAADRTPTNGGEPAGQPHQPAFRPQPAFMPHSPRPASAPE
jgi:hypothetical protein